MTLSKKLLAFDLGAESGRGVLGLFDGERLRLEVVHRFANNPVRILDALHIHETDEETESRPPAQLKIIWSKDWMKVALVIDGQVHALFDFEAHGGYNINEFPPPNEFWTQGDRKLTGELINRLF